MTALAIAIAGHPRRESLAALSPTRTASPHTPSKPTNRATSDGRATVEAMPARKAAEKTWIKYGREQHTEYRP